MTFSMAQHDHSLPRVKVLVIFRQHVDVVEDVAHLQWRSPMFHQMQELYWSLKCQNMNCLYDNSKLTYAINNHFICSNYS